MVGLRTHSSFDEHLCNFKHGHLRSMPPNVVCLALVSIAQVTDSVEHPFLYNQKLARARVIR